MGFRGFNLERGKGEYVEDGRGGKGDRGEKKVFEVKGERYE